MTKLCDIQRTTKVKYDIFLRYICDFYTRYAQWIRSFWMSGFKVLLSSILTFHDRRATDLQQAFIIIYHVTVQMWARALQSHPYTRSDFISYWIRLAKEHSSKTFFIFSSILQVNDIYVCLLILTSKIALNILQIL